MRYTFHTGRPARRTSVLAVMVTLLLSLTVSMTLGGAGPGGAAVLPVGSTARGQTYAQWASGWLSWVVQPPADQSPLLDNTGVDVGVGQSPGVWFLAGNFGGTTVRTATIPTGTPLFFPVVNEFWITTPGDPNWNDPYFDPITNTLYETWHDYVVEQILGPAVDAVTDYFCTVDGKPVNNLQGYRVLSEVSDAVHLPDNNIFGIPAGDYGPNQSEGYYLLLPPLSAGTHTIHFGGTAPNITLDVTYNLTVKPGK